MYERYGVTQANDFMFHEPATSNEVEEFQKEYSKKDFVLKEAEIPSKLDFQDGYLKSAWNKLQRKLVVDAAMHWDEAGGKWLQEGAVKREFLEIVALEQLERIRGVWFLARPKYLEVEKRWETIAEGWARATVILLNRRQNSKTINSQSSVGASLACRSRLVMFFLRNSSAETEQPRL
jgi:hypothetical protein